MNKNIVNFLILIVFSMQSIYSAELIFFDGIVSQLANNVMTQMKKAFNYWYYNRYVFYGSISAMVFFFAIMYRNYQYKIYWRDMRKILKDKYHAENRLLILVSKVRNGEKISEKNVERIKQLEASIENFDFGKAFINDHNARFVSKIIYSFLDKNKKMLNRYCDNLIFFLHHCNRLLFALYFLNMNYDIYNIENIFQAWDDRYVKNILIVYYINFLEMLKNKNNSLNHIIIDYYTGRMNKNKGIFNKYYKNISEFDFQKLKTKDCAPHEINIIDMICKYRAERGMILYLMLHQAIDIIDFNNINRKKKIINILINSKVKYDYFIKNISITQIEEIILFSK